MNEYTELETNIKKQREIKQKLADLEWQEKQLRDKLHRDMMDELLSLSGEA